MDACFWVDGLQMRKKRIKCGMWANWVWVFVCSRMSVNFVKISQAKRFIHFRWLDGFLHSFLAMCAWLCACVCVFCRLFSVRQHMLPQPANSKQIEKLYIFDCNIVSNRWHCLLLYVLVACAVFTIQRVWTMNTLKCEALIYPIHIECLFTTWSLQQQQQQYWCVYATKCSSAWHLISTHRSIFIFLVRFFLSVSLLCSVLFCFFFLFRLRFIAHP